jgi:nucleoside-diphosphate-sugar epimerase
MQPVLSQSGQLNPLLVATTMSSSNSNRTVIVTGAAGDLGQAIAVRLAEEGYRIAVTDLESRRADLQKTVDAINKTGNTYCFLVTGDVTKEEDVQNIVAETVKNLGPLEVVCCSLHQFRIPSTASHFGYRWFQMSGNSSVVL